MIREHDWDLNFWCRRCGCGVVHVEREEVDRECHAAGNVTAITHIVRGRRLDALVGIKREYACRSPG